MSLQALLNDLQDRGEARGFNELTSQLICLVFRVKITNKQTLILILVFFQAFASNGSAILLAFVFETSPAVQSGAVSSSLQRQPVGISKTIGVCS